MKGENKRSIMPADMKKKIKNFYHQTLNVLAVGDLTKCTKPKYISGYASYFFANQQSDTTVIGQGLLAFATRGGGRSAESRKRSNLSTIQIWGIQIFLLLAGRGCIFSQLSDTDTEFIKFE